MPAVDETFKFWIRERERKRAKMEEERAETLSSVIAWLDENARSYGVDEAFVFGSITHPFGFGPSSDVDIAITALDLGSQFGFGAALETAIDREVDVLTLNECRFADKIREEGVRWVPSRSAS